MRIKEYINMVHRFPFISSEDDNEDEVDEEDDMPLKLPLRVRSMPSASMEELYDFQNEMDILPDYNVEPYPNASIHGPQGIKGTYQGIKFDSRWEYIYYRWKKDVKCEYIERNTTENLPYFSNGREKKFYPDFKTTQGYVEVKGIFRPSDIEKQAAHPEVEFIDSSMMKDIIKELSSKIPSWKMDYEESTIRLTL